MEMNNIDKKKAITCSVIFLLVLMVIFALILGKMEGFKMEGCKRFYL
jgi:uncharacterized membrane protein YvbJ